MRPSKIVCIGLNYRDHARETGAPTPDEPIVFLKATSALAGPNDDLTLPRGSREDGLGGRARGGDRRAEPATSSEADALRHVAGYALHNDYSRARSSSSSAAASG